MIKIKTKKRFLGKIDNFIDKQERNFYKKMLKAYLRGAEVFTYGYKSINGIKQPVKHKVKFELY